jgi:sec-independent protein translocase protein TatC
MSDGEPGVADGGEPGVADGNEPGLYPEMDVDEPPPAPGHEGAPDDEEMPLADHIEEMVRRLGAVVLVMAVVAGIAFPFGDRIINFLWYNVLPGGDVARPHVYHPLALMLARLKVSTLAGFIVALPVFVYETYLFMRPGLYPRERKYYLAAVPTSVVLAAVGVAFAFYLVLPAIFVYFLYYSQGAANIAFGLTETFDLIVLMLGTFAFIFQIPLFIMLAIMMGVTTRRWLETRRLYFWGGFLTLAFLFSPDPTGMAPIIVAATMITLFEGTLLLLRWTGTGGRGQGLTLESFEAARPAVWVLGAGAGYVASAAPMPRYYDQLPAVLTDALAGSGLLSVPLVIGGGAIALYEGLNYLLARMQASVRVRRAVASVRLPVWLLAVVVGYLGSPNPTLVTRLDVAALSPALSAAVAVAVVGVYEVGMAVGRWRQSGRVR